MRNKRQSRPPQKLADSDYSVTNTKSKNQKNVTKKDVVKDTMENIETVGEGAKCEGNNRKLDGSDGIVNGKEEGEKCVSTENVVNEIVDKNGEVVKVHDVGDCDSDVQNVNKMSEDTKDSGVDIGDKGIVENNGDLESGNKQNVSENGEKDGAQRLNRSGGSGDKTYAASTTVTLNDLCKKLFVIPTEVDENEIIIFKANMTVKEFVMDESGQWPAEWSYKFPTITQLQQIVLNPERKDMLLWKRNDGSLHKFSIRQAYRDMIENGESVNWHKLVWFYHNIPNHAFILWLAIQMKLPTQYKIKKNGEAMILWCVYSAMVMKTLMITFFLNVPTQVNYGQKLCRRLKWMLITQTGNGDWKIWLTSLKMKKSKAFWDTEKEWAVKLHVVLCFKDSG
ncbi:RNA-directed DNA polymerase, eukaryota, Reverse transcriptase zinc-binding domain protein [Artemisia annua]|uniref:RNA-directed DNA polymerase, eukaryota, Reverse transcriptase zinc-binding domain protein n=1 Tax=Artemisia annua TaxID=35608 RepID=A0A2U1LBR4_ARTAN|nr:RNA-directed DNA polymerase, eukaryota, Reverse transcriptase zinc-binding domain protein [Artemisia annua]